jgi:rhodanese-related sulfurtransferase
MGIFNFFGLGNNDSEKVAEYIQNGALIIDVRTPAEFNDGHADGSVNIPLSEVASQIKKIKKYNKPIITCCRSGARSGTAANILNNNDIDSINGGPWQNVANQL